MTPRKGPNSRKGVRWETAAVNQDHQISQAQYYQWRDQFLAHAPKAFEVAQQTEREARLQHENARLKKLVGELTLELKESDEAV